MEQKLQEDSLFYYHSSEDRIVLSHALFWTMTQLQFFNSIMRKEKFILLLRQYEEKMLDAFLQKDDIDYHFNKVKCRKIEMMMPKLMKMVESEMGTMRYRTSKGPI